ncbi:MAG: hypothetical protein ABEJ31_12845 [Haloarculaceae archaeon]
MDDEKASDEATASGAHGTDVLAPPPAVLGLDHVYDALGHSRRRYLCYTLLEDTEWTLAELAEKVAAWERQVPEHEVSEREREQVFVSLYHAHVPKLVDHDVLAFDEATETITPGANAEQVLAALSGMGASLDSSQESHARGESDE